jgi:dipeptidyl aminopeptidase/acylaminoacyl peptidase
LLLTLALVVVGYYAVLFFAQRRILFPVPSSPGVIPLRNAQFVQIASPAGAVDAYYLAPTKPVAGAAPLILFTHGNAELATGWVGAFGEPRSWGFAVLLLEYPGYSGAAGSPSEKSITAAVLAAYDWAAHDPRIDSGAIVALGRSIGTGAAVHLAAARPVAAGILQSPVTSVHAFARTLRVARPPDARGSLLGPLAR